MTQTESRARWGAALVAVAPLVATAGLVMHPFLPFVADEEAIADAVVAQPTRWAVAHLVFAVGATLLAAAFVTIRSFLRDAGEERWSGGALPFAVLGSAIFAILPGLEFAPYAAAETGGDVAATQEALFPYFIPLLVSGAVFFAVGAIGFARAILASGVMSRGTALVVATSLVVLAIARFVPLGVVQFYVHGAAALVALWPIAATMWGRRELEMVVQPAPRSRSLEPSEA